MLNASPTGLKYRWMKNGQLLDTSNSVIVTDSGNYSVVVANASGCSDSSSVNISVNPIPVASIAGSLTFCSGESSILKASPVGMTYKWLKDGQPQLGMTDSLTVTDSGVYKVIVSNASECSDSTSVSVIVNPIPVAVITGSLSFCVGNSTLLKATPSGLSYQWERNGQQLVSTDSLSVTDSGHYSVVVSNSDGCSDSTTVHVIENPGPTVSILRTDTVTSTGVILIASSGVSYLWSTKDSTQTISVSKSDSFFVTVTDSNGCTSTSPVFDFVPHCGEQLLEEALQGVPITIDGITPNPATDAFTVFFQNPNASPIHYEVDDVLGRTLTSGETSVSQLSLSARDLPVGVLLLRASSNGVVQTRQFVVVK